MCVVLGTLCNINVLLRDFVQFDVLLGRLEKDGNRKVSATLHPGHDDSSKSSSSTVSLHSSSSAHHLLSLFASLLGGSSSQSSSDRIRSLARQRDILSLSR